MRGVANAGLLFGAVILAIAALWHLYWVAGGKLGLARAVPEHSGRPLFVPSKAATVAAGTLIGSLASFYFSAALNLLPPFLSAAEWAVTLGSVGAVLIARAVGDFRRVGFFNRGGSSAFAVADRMIYSPLCLFLGLAGLNAAAVRLL